MKDLQLNIDKLNLKKEAKTNKSYSLYVSNIAIIEKLADENDSNASTILNDILNHVFKLYKEVL